MGGKVILLCLVLIFSIPTVSAGSEKPTATFSADVTEGYAPLHVHFTSETTGDPTSYFWTFEPETSSDWNSHHPESASHTFQNPGVYDISLVVTNSAGSYKVTEPNYITVMATPTPTPTDIPAPTEIPTPTPTQKPTATFSADVTEGYVPLHVHFTSETTGDPTSYFWTFEPQTSSDWNSHHPESAGHTFQNPGVYDISLVVTNSAGSYTVTEPNYITVMATPTPTTADTSKPTPMETPTDTPTCQPTPPVPSPTDQSGQYTTSRPVPSPTDQPGPSINLHSTKTTAPVGEEMQNTLSVVNLMDKPIMHAQVIFIPPSGISVISLQFVQSGGGQYTSTYDINPGAERNIEVNLVANQVGNFNVTGKVHYYFGDDKTNAKDYLLDLPIQVSDPQPTPTPIPKPIPDLGVASSIFILMTAFILKINKK